MKLRLFTNIEPTRDPKPQLLKLNQNLSRKNVITLGQSTYSSENIASLAASINQFVYKTKLTAIVPLKIQYARMFIFWQIHWLSNLLI